MFQGFVILMMYVIASEHPFIKLFKKIKKKEELEEHISEPIKGILKKLIFFLNR